MCQASSIGRAMLSWRGGGRSTSASSTTAAAPPSSDSGGQERAALDPGCPAAPFPTMRCVSPAVRIGLQPGQLPALASSCRTRSSQWSLTTLPPGSCATAATLSSCWPRWRCRGPCSPASYVGSSVGEGHRWWPDHSEPWSAPEPGETMRQRLAKPPTVPEQPRGAASHRSRCPLSCLRRVSG